MQRKVVKSICMKIGLAVRENTVVVDILDSVLSRHVPRLIVQFLILEICTVWALSICRHSHGQDIVKHVRASLAAELIDGGKSLNLCVN